MRVRLILLLVLCLASLADATRPSGQWRTLKIGGGGYITGISISNDGSTRCVRADTYGAYCYDFQNAIWQQVVRVSNMPPGNVSPGGNGDGFGRGGGVYEIAVAPNLATRVYMVKAGSAFRSNDRAQTWSLMSGFTPVATTSTEANDGSLGQKFAGQKIAVDPSDPNVVLIGTISDGLWRTNNGGTSFTQIASVPATGRIAAIAFGTSGTVWLGSLATGAVGVYKSVDNGVTFALQAGGPNGVAGGPWMGVASGGNYWTTWGDPAGAPHKSLWMNNAGVWTDCTPLADQVLSPQGLAMNAAGTRIAIAADGNSGNPIAVQFSPAVCSSATWEAAFTLHNETYPNAPWLQFAIAAALFTGGGQIGINKGALAYDPQVNKLWVTSGVGVWSVPANSVAPTLAWTEDVKGIEQLVTQKILVAPTSGGGGTDVPLIANWDFGNRRSTDPEAYQSATWKPGTKFTATWDLDYANDDPNFIVAHNCWGATAQLQTSVDNGVNWVTDPNMPPGASTSCDSTWGRSGNLAVSTKLNWVWMPTYNGVSVSAGYYTTDGGNNWIKIVLPSPMTDDNNGAHGWPVIFGSYQLNRTATVADRATNGTFYMYAYQNGLLKTVNGGATWTWADGANPPTNALPNNGGFDDTGFNAKLSAVPGKAGHLFFTSGQQDNTGGNIPQGNPLYRTTNGGATNPWTKVPNVLEVQALGYGRNVLQADGSTYPRILIVGWVNNVWGVWKSDDNTATWVNIPGSSGTAYPLDKFDAIGAIEGDKTGDKVYISFRGSGAGFLALGDDTYTGLNARGVTAQNIGGGSGPQCSDGIDNDGDTLIDFPADTGCTSASDNDENDWNAVPLTFSSPLFTGMTEVSNTSIGCTASHLSVTNYGKNGCDTPISWSFVRTTGNALGDDLAACQRVNGCTSVTVNNSYLSDCQNVGEHSDTIQTFNHGTGTTPSAGNTVTYIQSFIDNTQLNACTAPAAAYRNSDGGWPSTVSMRYVYVKNSAGLLFFTGDAQPFPQHLSFDNVCYEGGATAFGPFGGGTIIVDKYINVRNCTISGGNIVFGSVVHCSALLSTGGGTVTGCPD